MCFCHPCSLFRRSYYLEYSRSVAASEPTSFAISRCPRLVCCLNSRHVQTIFASHFPIRSSQPALSWRLAFRSLVLAVYRYSLWTEKLSNFLLVIACRYHWEVYRPYRAKFDSWFLLLVSWKGCIFPCFQKWIWYYYVKIYPQLSTLFHMVSCC